MEIVNNETLIAFVERKNKVKYTMFWGHRKPKSGVGKSCFSQWYPATFKIDGHRYLTAEHYMMAQKALLFGDTEIFKQVLQATSPNKVKALGRQVEGFDQAVWEQKRFDIVVAANLAKFGQNPELKDFLMQTGNRVLVEASPVDKIWGIGLAEDDDKAQNPRQWQGLNLLGYALMVVRQKLL